MKHSIALGTILTALLAGCASTPQSPAISELSGKRGESPADCQANPHTISFSALGDLMIVSYQEGGTADGKLQQESFTYQVLGKSPSGLQLALVGETRKDSSGQVVTWELRQPDTNSYCWWRSDWPVGECTVQRIRCGL